MTLDLDAIERTGRTHMLKSWPEGFGAMRAGLKTFEIRRDDRGGFRAGDILHLDEWDPVSERYTGRAIIALVTYVFSRDTTHLAEILEEGTAALSIAVLAVLP